MKKHSESDNTEMIMLDDGNILDLKAGEMIVVTMNGSNIILIRKSVAEKYYNDK